jgi:hypothetical protein
MSDFKKFGQVEAEVASETASAIRIKQSSCLHPSDKRDYLGESWKCLECGFRGWRR